MNTFSIVRVVVDGEEQFFLREDGTFNKWRVVPNSDCVPPQVRSSIQQFIEEYRDDPPRAVAYARKNWTSIDAEGDTILGDDFADIVKREILTGCNQVRTGLDTVASSADVGQFFNDEPLMLWECSDLGGADWLTEALEFAIAG